MAYTSLSIDIWTDANYWYLLAPLAITASGVAWASGLWARIAPKIKPLPFAAALIALGLLLNTVLALFREDSSYQLSGPLQMVGMATAICVLLKRVSSNWQGWSTITASLAILQTLILTIYAKQCPAAVMTAQCNISKAVDSVWQWPLTDSINTIGYDPYGLIALFGTVISISSGLTLGYLARSLRSREPRTTKWRVTSFSLMLAMSISFAILAVLLQLTFPVFLSAQLPFSQVLWTSSWALYPASAVGIIFALGMLVAPDKQRTHL